MYLGNMRGTIYGRSHTTFDPDASGPDGAADFWNFDESARATKDVPAMISTILNRRLDNNLGCEKVHIIDSAFTSILTAATFPTTASETIAQIFVQNPCFVTNKAFVTFGGILQAVRRLTSEEDTCDKNPYKDALRVLLGELCEDDFL